MDFSRHGNAITELGAEVGHDVARIFASNNLANLGVKLSSFWTTGGLGDMRVVRKDPLSIEVKNCLDSVSWKLGAQATSCTLKKTFMMTVFEDVLNKSIRIEETECCRRQAPACRFTVSEKLAVSPY